MSDQDPRDPQPGPAPLGPPTVPEPAAGREPGAAPGPGSAPASGAGTASGPAPGGAAGRAGPLGPPTQAGYGDAGYGDTAYGQGYGHGHGPSYGAGQPGIGGPVAPAPPRQPLDLARLVGIAAWVVVGLFGLWYLYFISNDDNGGEFVDRFFGGMDRLGEGLFYAGVLHAVSLWLGRNQGRG